MLKTEPGTYSIDDLAGENNQTTHWEGVRNYQARNLLRDEIRKGDQAFFYHSVVKPAGIVGIVTVVRSGYPDHLALDPKNPYFDPKASPENPIWYMVDVKLRRRFREMIPLDTLKKTPGLEGMEVCRKGSRLSVQPVTAQEWKIVLGLVRGL